MSEQNIIDSLLPLVRQKCLLFKQLAKSKICDVQIISGKRTFAEQHALYLIGRETAGNRVTNADAGQSFHNYGVAFDFVPLISGVPVWENNDLWEKLGALGESLGFTWGGHFNTIHDLDHMQLDFGHTWQEFKAGTVNLTKYNLPTNLSMDNSTASPKTPAEAASTTGNATLYEVVNKHSGVVYPVDHLGSGDENHDGIQDFIVHHNGDEIVFTNPDYQNPDFTVRQRGTNLLPNGKAIV